MKEEPNTRALSAQEIAELQRIGRFCRGFAGVGIVGTALSLVQLEPAPPVWFSIVVLFGWGVAFAFAHLWAVDHPSYSANSFQSDEGSYHE